MGVVADTQVAVQPRTGVGDLPPNGPTYNGFVTWVTAVMQVPSNAMPDANTLEAAYCQALNLAYSDLASVPSNCSNITIYTMAVYNLGGAILVEYAQDNPGSTFWSDLRSQLRINDFVPGLVNQAHDQGTGEGMYILPIFSGLTLLGLQLLKTPWGRAYLQFAGQWGPIWGLT